MQCSISSVLVLPPIHTALHTTYAGSLPLHLIQGTCDLWEEEEKNCDTVSAPLSSLHTVGSRDHVVATDRQAVERLMMPPLLSCVVQCRLQRTSPDPDDCSWNPVYATLFGTVPMTVRSSHTNTSRALLFLFTTFFSYY